jgi:hypothetical protein
MTDPVSRPSLSSSRPFLLVWAIYSVGMLLGVHFLLFPSGLTERMDFRQLYAGGYLARTDPGNLYNFDRQMTVQSEVVGDAERLLPYNHPAYEAWLIAPLSRLSYRTAYFSFLCINLVLLLACFFAGRDIFSRPGVIAQPKPGLQLFAFYPVTLAILQGQDSLFFLLGLCVCYRLLRTGNVFLVGGILGLSLFKPQIALPIAMFLVARYGYSMLAGFAGGGLIVTAASLALVGWQGLISLGRVLLLTGSVSVARSLPAGTFGVFPLIMLNVRGLIAGLLGWLLSGTIILVLTMAVSAFLGVWIMQMLRRTRPDSSATFCLTVTAAILVSYHLYVHDLSVMLVPIGLMSGIKTSYTSKATVALYLVLPCLLIVAHKLLFLLALPIWLFLYGTSQAIRKAADWTKDGNSAEQASTKIITGASRR